MKVGSKKYSAIVTLSMMMFNILVPFGASAGSSDELIFPIKEISKLECRFQDFDTLSSSCKRSLPVLSPDDYSKYATKNGGYNEYTRIYTVLWGASYKYGWDVGNGGHQGTDIATAKGTPVYTIADGKVIEAGNDIGWGNYVSIEHTIKGKKVISNYAHLSKIKVDKGDRVDVGDKIGEVGSTGNSTGNHLHFQIDLPSSFHPYYYDWNACPYSYYEITEKGVCFDELAKHTFDPLEFLESNGAILDDVDYDATSSNTSSSKSTTSSSSSSNNSNNTSSTSSTSSTDVFDTTVYYGYGNSSDVKNVQRIYNKLGYYDGRISGDFKDLEASIIKYQIASGVISHASEDGAGWFGPKTRTQTKKDYDAYVASGGQSVIAVSKQEKTSAKQKQEVKKVSRENLMTREEREAQEMEEFLNIYKIDFKNTLSQILQEEVKTTILRIENKKGKGFRGNTPGNVSFSYDKDIISVFPESFYNFNDGEREISITGKKSGHTNITIKIGEVIVKTLSISVGQPGEKPTATSAKIITSKQATLGEKNTGIILMKDQYDNALVKSEFPGEFELKADENIQYCIKRGRIQDIKEIYKRNCFKDEYRDSLSYTYDDTIAGILVFDYKVLTDTNTQLTLKNRGGTLASSTLTVSTPKGLASSYEYYDEVIETLTAGMSEAENKGYFLEDRAITRADAINWIENTGIQNKEILQEDRSITKNMSRKEFLELSYKYLGNNTTTTASQDYRDMQGDDEILVASLLGDDYQWRDDFGEKYFQPDKDITRGEAAYMLMTALREQGHMSIVRK